MPTTTSYTNVPWSTGMTLNVFANCWTLATNDASDKTPAIYQAIVSDISSLPVINYLCYDTPDIG